MNEHIQRDGGEGGLRRERMSRQNIPREGDDRDQVGRGVPGSRRNHLPLYELAKHGEFGIANPRNSLQKGPLPGLQLDELHALESLGGGVDSLVFHLHELLLDGRQLRGDQARERDHEENHDDAANRGPLQLQPEENHRPHDLEGTRPNRLEIRSDVLELLTVHFHEIHDFALVVQRAGSGAQTKRFIVHHCDAARTETKPGSEAKIEVVSQAETLKESREEQNRTIRVSVRLHITPPWKFHHIRILIVEKGNHLSEHNRSNKLANVVNQLQESSKQKRKSKGACHTLENTRPMFNDCKKATLFAWFAPKLLSLCQKYFLTDQPCCKSANKHSKLR